MRTNNHKALYAQKRGPGLHQTNSVATGICHIEGISVLPFQIVVTRELPGKEYAGFRAISKKPKEADILQVIKERNDKTDPFLLSQYQTYLNKLEKIDRKYLTDP